MAKIVQGLTICYFGSFFFKNARFVIKSPRQRTHDFTIFCTVRLAFVDTQRTKQFAFFVNRRYSAQNGIDAVCPAVGVKAVFSPP
jgi:hypothetical protein